MSTAVRMPEPPAAQPSASRHSALADPDLYRALLRYARRRVPEHEADDVVQATLADALAAERGPDDPTEVRRWVHRIARNKIVDTYRRGKRELPSDLESEAAEAESAPVSARDLLRWAERELPQGESHSTLEWMLREGDGEKLEHLAEEAAVPAPTLRQRVSRLRRHFRSRWAAQLAAAAVVAAIVIASLAVLRSQPSSVDEIAGEPAALPPEELARELRRAALDQCSAERWDACERGLDEARRLDPSGESEEPVVRARAAAAGARRPAPPEPTELKEPPPAPPVAPQDVKKKAPPKPLTTAAPNKLSEPPLQKKAPPLQQKGGSFDSK